MIKIVFTISILFYSSNWVESLEIPIITNIQDIIRLSHDIGDIVSGNIPLQNLSLTQEGPMADVMGKINGITRRIENQDTQLDAILATMIAQLSLRDNLINYINRLQNYITIVNSTYNIVLQFSKNISNLDNDTVEEMIVFVTSTEPNLIPDILKKIFNIIGPKQTTSNQMNFLENLAERRKSMNPLTLCDTHVSYQNQLLQIYNLISITEIKAFLMTALAYRMKNELQRDKSSVEFDWAQNDFIEKLDQYLNEFQKNMLQASREIFLCDPKSLTDQGTYVEFEGLFTAYVVNEYEMNLEFEWSCTTTCRDIYSWAHPRCYDINGPKYCTKHPCKGLIRDCGWIGGDVDVCEYNKDYLKRYNYVRSYTNGWYGKWSPCVAGNMSYHQVNGRLWRGYSCDTCMCRCEESYGSSRAIRTFSLRPQISNIDENKVISDIKFTMKDKMIHIQIEEAPLLPLGQLAKNESSWVPLEDFVYLSNVTVGGWVQVKDGKYIPMTRDTDFAFIRRDQRILNLDEISGGPNFVLTGVRLRHESEKYSDDEKAGNISPIQLEIYVTPFDYTSGKLMPTEANPSVWLTPLTQPELPSAYANPRKELKIGEKVYRWENAPSPPNVQPNQYIEFKQSSIHSDIGQSTIPFMDSRPTAPSSPIAFDGLGLMYRGHEKFGGFVLLKAMTIDLTHYMDSSMTAKQEEYYPQSVPSNR